MDIPKNSKMKSTFISRGTSSVDERPTPIKCATPRPYYKQIDDHTAYLIQEANEANTLTVFPDMKEIDVPFCDGVYTYRRKDAKLGVIDVSFASKFITQYVVLQGLPECFNGDCEDYKKIISKLVYNLQKGFEEANSFMGPHRTRTFKFLMNIAS